MDTQSQLKTIGRAATAPAVNGNSTVEPVRRVRTRYGKAA